MDGCIARVCCVVQVQGSASFRGAEHQRLGAQCTGAGRSATWLLRYLLRACAQAGTARIVWQGFRLFSFFVYLFLLLVLLVLLLLLLLLLLLNDAFFVFFFFFSRYFSRPDSGSD